MRYYYGMSEKQTKSRRKPGRPTDYRGAVTCELVATAPLPATVAQLAEHLGTSYRVLYDWMEAHPAFLQAVTRRRAEADDNIEGSLYGRGLGYTTTVTEERLDKDGCVHALNKDVHLPADPNAAMNWLKNRRPDQWREKTEVEITGDFVERVKRAAAASGVLDDDA